MLCNALIESYAFIFFLNGVLLVPAAASCGASSRNNESKKKKRRKTNNLLLPVDLVAPVTHVKAWICACEKEPLCV